MSQLEELKSIRARLLAKLDKTSEPHDMVKLQEELNELKRKIKALEGRLIVYQVQCHSILFKESEWEALKEARLD